jgi:hypothetical protein
VPRWDNAPQAHSRVSNTNFDILKQIVERVLYKYPIKNMSRTAKFFFQISKLIFDTLYDHEMYDMAFDTLKRFKIQKKVTNFKIVLKSVYL